jgi:metal-responsive CopG/Arc/MetJ family transcriptional regulator
MWVLSLIKFLEDKLLMARIKEVTCAFSVRFPVSLTEEIDQLCSSNYITRTSWLIKAAKEKIDRERVNSTEDLIAKIAKIADEN